LTQGAIDVPSGIVFAKGDIELAHFDLNGNRRTGAVGGTIGPIRVHFTLPPYNYTPTPNIVYNRKLMRRIVWDGSQEIAEVQVQDSTPVVEMDTGHVKLARAADGTDNNPFYGQVLFTFGAGAIDQPLSVTRINYADASDSLDNALPYFQWPIISIMPLWNAMGRWDTAILPDYYETSEDTTHSLKYNLQVGWQSYALYPPSPQRSWLGSVLQGKLDQVGTAYRRARVYDPATGQFTQEDPLGLGGGLNAYGFANGDPVNYDDPFGLCTQADHWTNCTPGTGSGAMAIAQQISDRHIGAATAEFAAVGVVGGAAGAVAGGGEAVSAGVVRLTGSGTGRTLLPVAASAIAKLEALGDKFGASATQIANQALTLGTKLVDNLEENLGNINHIIPRLDGESGFIRVTTDPTGSRIISAGLQTANQVSNGLQSGRFTPSP
jgi:RHS repeat-associated protein